MSEEIIDYDELGMYLGKDFIINDKIRIHQPTIGEIAEWGEQKYYSMASTLCTIPSDMKSVLEDLGLDYVTLPDFELFIILTRGLKRKDTSILLGDLDLSKMERRVNPVNGKTILINEDEDITIDERIYRIMVGYIRKLHGFRMKVEKPATKTVRKILIQLDREERAKKKNSSYSSQLKYLISAMMRYPGFKYKTNELYQCGLYEFMDEVKGAAIYVSSTALLKGMYSGMIDTKGINKKDLDWMRDPEEKEKKKMEAK